MKRSLFKQLMVSALFSCSLSADVPDVRQTGDRPTSNAENPKPAVGLAARQAGACLPLSSSAWREADVHLGNGHIQGLPGWPAALSAGNLPDPLACAPAAVWPLDSFGIIPIDRSCVRWDVPPSVSPEAMSVPTDPLDVALLCPRYQLPLALQSSAWMRPVGSSELTMSLGIAGGAGRADMAAMIPRLKKIFLKEGVPQQWVWMAEVESALNPRARSSAGAVGLFQLMPATAQRFGLQTAPVDDRMHPEKSAGAAAQYLKFLRKEFGCWSLALAAYNAGEGRVREIMKKRNARTFIEVERYLPAETKAYVPKVMAVVAMREDQTHGIPGAYWMP